MASPDLTSVAIVTALTEAACDFREPIVPDVFQRKALVGVFFLQLCNSNEMRKWVCHNNKIQSRVSSCFCRYSPCKKPLPTCKVRLQKWPKVIRCISAMFDMVKISQKKKIIKILERFDIMAVCSLQAILQNCSWNAPFALMPHGGRRQQQQHVVWHCEVVCAHERAKQDIFKDRYHQKYIYTYWNDGKMYFLHGGP